MERLYVELCSRSFAYPIECPCCGADPDSELDIQLSTTSGRTLASNTATRVLFPYCERCIEHVAIADAASGALAVIVLVSGISAIAVGLAEDVILGLVVFGVAVAVGMLVASVMRSRARAACNVSCASHRRAVRYHGWSGSTSLFSLDSPSYTARFAEENRSNLVSVEPQLHALLDKHQTARLLVPTPAVAVPTLPRSVEDWLAYFARLPSRVRRRLALQQALATIDDVDDRERLIDDVCRLELLDIVDEIAGASSLERWRYLRRAIVETRADNLPEPLRAAMLRGLEFHAKH